MSKNTSVVDEEMSMESFMDSWEKEGAAISNPVLNEGNYKAHIVEFTTRYGISSNNKEKEERPWQNWGVKLTLESETAKTVMKRDKDVLVYADSDTICLGKGNLALFPFGIDKQNNAALWKLVGKLLEGAELATVTKDDSGAEEFNIDLHIVKSIYQGTDELRKELLSNSEVDGRLIPAKLAELQFKNLSELITAEKDTSECYVHIARRSAYNDPTKKQHFVKNIMMKAAFEDDTAKVDSLVI
jgi:hypothetical protein